MIRCARCSEYKPRTDFYESSLERQPNSSWCKTCKKVYQRAKQRTHDLPRRFGITVQDYDRMLADQGGVCAICDQPSTEIRRGALLRLHVDHDHATGEVRGLLCGKCNRAAGLLGDDPARARALAAYLTSTAANVA